MRLIILCVLLVSTITHAKINFSSQKETDSKTYYLNESGFFVQENKLKKSFKFIYEAIEFAEKQKDFKSETYLYSKLGDLYYKYNKYAKTLYEKGILLDKSGNVYLFDNAKLNGIDIQKTLDKTNSQQEKQEKDSKFSKLISILSLALISILSLLSLSLYRNNLIRTQSNLLLKEKNAELELAKESAERSSAARADFLSTVSHELRTPLNAIIGITHLLIDEDPKPAHAEYLKSLRFSGNHLLNYINEILEVNRIESKNIEVETINFNLKKLLSDIQNSLKEMANKNNNRFTLEIDDNIPDYLLGDPTKLSQIFMNLINNALKFTSDGAVSVVTKMSCQYDDKVTLRFEIIDNGIGIPIDKLEVVFDSFAQASVEINRKYGGTGLGLSIVKRLVEIQGGKINLKSELGKGTNFSFNLDFTIADIPIVSSDNEIFYDIKNFIFKKILLVEDNKINQMITKRMLEKKQMICKIVENGEDAVQEVRNNDFDLILMDVHLPGISGTIATEQIRLFDKETPIIALTAISLHENQEMLMSFGIDAVITKPFEPDNLFTIIAEYLLKKNKFNKLKSIL